MDNFKFTNNWFNDAAKHQWEKLISQIRVGLNWGFSILSSVEINSILSLGIDKTSDFP